MINVLQICYTYPPNFSGYGKQLKTLNSSLLISDKCSIKIITAFDVGSANSQNIKSLYWFKRNSVNTERLFFYLFCFFMPIRFFLDFMKCDIVHIVKAGPEAAIAVFIAKVLGKKTVIKIAQDEIDLELKTLGRLKKLRLKLIFSADNIIAISKKIKNDLIRLGYPSEKIVNIPNSVQKSNFIISDTEVKYSQFNFIYVGSVCMRKGVDDMLNAFSNSSFESQVTLKIVGPDYKDVPQFYERIINLNTLENLSVFYTGPVDNVVELISKSDCLILPSYSEGMPNVVLESLICGVPALVSNIEVHNELINDSNGVVYRLGDINDLAEKLQVIHRHDFSKIEISKVANEKFSVENIAAQYLKLYLSL
jgi:glycosyltransferase involved in cell wall biosynthesis